MEIQFPIGGTEEVGDLGKLPEKKVLGSLIVNQELNVAVVLGSEQRRCEVELVPLCVMRLEDWVLKVFHTPMDWVLHWQEHLRNLEE